MCNKWEGYSVLCACVCMCVEARDIFPNSLPSYVLGQGRSLNVELVDWRDWLASEPQ